MFEHVNGQDSIKMAVAKRQPFLAIANQRLHVLKPGANGFGHILAQLQRYVITLLLRCQPFIVQMGSQTGPDFKGAKKISQTVPHRIAMVEVIDDAKVFGQHLMPVMHEVVADRLLFGGQWRHDLWPDARFHRALFNSSAGSAAVTSASFTGRGDCSAWPWGLSKPMARS